MRKPWTTLETAEFVEMYKAGVPIPEIARRTGRTTGACVGKAFRDGLFASYPRNRKTTVADKKRVLGMLREGNTDAHTARVAGLHKNTVTHLRRAWGIPPLSGSEFRRRGAKVRLRRKPVVPTEIQSRILAVVSGGPLLLGEIHARLNGAGGNKRTVNRHLTRMRRKGLVACEGKPGRSAKWFSVGWWLGANQGLVWTAANKIAKKSPHLDREDIASMLMVEVASAAKSFRPRGWKFSTYALGAAYKSVKQWAVTEFGRGIHYASQVRMTAPLETAVRAFECEVEHPDRADRSPPVSPRFWDDAVTGLNPRIAPLVVGHFRDGKTYQELGAGLGVCRERVRQLIEEGLEQIRKKKNLDDYAA